MKAAVYTRYGPPDVVQIKDVEKSVPKVIPINSTAPLLPADNTDIIWESYDRLCNMPVKTLVSLFYFLSLVPYMAQQPRIPNIEAQRTAMKKLEFMVGRWAGEARLLHGPGDPVSLMQTEEAQYKLDGLILVVDGVGRTKADGKPALQALGIISYDDESGTYRMRAFNDGRFLETELKLLDSGKGISWGFSLGQIRTSSVMQITEKGDWTELTEITIGSEPPKKYMELTVSRQK